MEILFFVSAALLPNSREPINIITAFYVTICIFCIILKNGVPIKFDLFQKLTLRKKDQMTLKANWFRSKIIQGPSEDRRYQRPFKVLRKIFEIKFHSKLIERSSQSKFIQGTPTFFMIDDHSWILRIVRIVATREATLQQPIKNVLSKWIDGNSVVESLTYSRGILWLYCFFDAAQWTCYVWWCIQSTEGHVFWTIEQRVLTPRDFFFWKADENLSAKSSNARKSFEKRVYQEKHTPVGVTEISVSYLPPNRGFILEFVYRIHNGDTIFCLGSFVT